ncbi:hypothetical protein [Roseateles puraquae]|uniref:Uncharacterized protein n=1 Tax=Roseateles puraquae TaxID=431059 RepID=A0A254NDF5_9BURK|nr:hypothetical protein [Roseateles puraquae]MDG0854963.1 hypothetical protein [Roseateles puraquae]OWR04407.1 hypothetical protein CDO81_07395 [Roseateles puraquae]
MSADLDRVGRAFALVALAAATIGVGAVGLCGGYWTVKAVPALLKPGGGGAIMVLMISVPSLIGGVLLARLCVRKLVRWREPPASHDLTDRGD